MPFHDCSSCFEKATFPLQFPRSTPHVIQAAFWPALALRLDGLYRKLPLALPTHWYVTKDTHPNVSRKKSSGITITSTLGQFCRETNHNLIRGYISVYVQLFKCRHTCVQRYTL